MIEIIITGKMPEQVTKKYECACENCQTVFRLDESDWDHGEGSYNIVYVSRVNCPFCKTCLFRSNTNTSIIYVNEKGEKVTPTSNIRLL
jgi:hypothetical protein